MTDKISTKYRIDIENHDIVIRFNKDDINQGTLRKFLDFFSQVALEKYDTPNQAKHSPLKRRPFGLCKGEIHISDDFDAPLPDHILDAFEGK